MIEKKLVLVGCKKKKKKIHTSTYAGEKVIKEKKIDKTKKKIIKKKCKCSTKEKNTL